VGGNCGGGGLRRGGGGLIREFEFLAPPSVTLLTERRSHAPWGLLGADDGKPGLNFHNGDAMASKLSIGVAAGERLTVETPGGGGWGKR